MKKLTATIVAILALGGLLGGCAGLDANTATTTIINSGATGASALLPEAQAGTLSLSDALAVLVNVGEQAKLLHGQLVGTTGLTYLFSPQAHGLLVTDPAYVPVLNELLANMLASEDRARALERDGADAGVRQRAGGAGFEGAAGDPGDAAG